MKSPAEGSELPSLALLQVGLDFLWALGEQECSNPLCCGTLLGSFQSVTERWESPSGRAELLGKGLVPIPARVSFALCSECSHHLLLPGVQQAELSLGSGASPPPPDSQDCSLPCPASDPAFPSSPQVCADFCRQIKTRSS